MIRVIYNPVAGPKMVRKIGSVREILSAGKTPFEIRETAGHGGGRLPARGDRPAGGGRVFFSLGLVGVGRRGAGADGRPGKALSRHRGVFPGGGGASPPATAEPLGGTAGEGADGGPGRHRLPGGKGRRRGGHWGFRGPRGGHPLS